MAKKRPPKGDGSGGAEPPDASDPAPSHSDGHEPPPPGQMSLGGDLLGDAGPAKTAYVVLARKYRPQSFEDLIGQEAMVTTLTNAFAADRIAQAYMLTGVRGVGKTTTARILARALNFAREGQPEKPTIDLPKEAAAYGRHCADIMASRHPDVVEMDAASNTGIDNIREIIESARYKPILARYKVFIIDEVHMLSKGAFNALLKTLEEPPPFVKFIFATTEIRKVPVTVLSRCQRFDLRRVDVPVLAAHFRRIVEAEGAKAEDEALTSIARAAEGSVRDGLSILDQAIAMGSSAVTAELVRRMLGLADRGRVFDLLDLVLGADPRGALAALTALHRDGAEPAQILADLAEAVHAATRVKVAGAEAAGDSLSAEERRRASALAGTLSLAILSRAWQMLLKGLEEVGKAPDPLAAAEMVLIRLAYTADLPPPGDVIRRLGSEEARPQRRSEASDPAADRRAPLAEAPRASVPPAPTAGRSAPPPPAAPRQPTSMAPSSMGEEADGEAGDPEDDPESVPAVTQGEPRTFADIAALAGKRRDIKLKVHLEEHVSPVRFEPGRLELRLLPGAPPGFAGDLSDKLARWTGRRWVVAISNAPGQKTLGEERRAREAAELERVKAHPAVQAVLAQFPGAEIKVRETLTPPAGRDDDSQVG